MLVIVLSGEFSGIKVAYLGSQRDLGVILDVFNGLARWQTEAGSQLTACGKIREEANAQTYLKAMEDPRS